MEKGLLICQSFVGVFKQPLMVIPNMDGKFCRDLFGMPYDTFNGITPEGYVIAINNKPFPMVVINPAKIIVKAENKELLLKYVDAVKQELKKMGVPLSLSAFGINSEFQWLGLDANAETWLWNHFIDKNINTGNDYHMCNKINMRIGINDNQFANVEVMPRMGIRNGLFANINHHHNVVLDDIPDTEDLDKYICESDSTIHANIINKIIEK